ncbi:uncharacterized protein BKA55DRAFT_725354 [Fusarium redolens]|uniref:Chromo domain-containing protein n=1 Tax=Fusarium redolens TaxID=48865 RepID=A0A9P9HDC4_FUSRE|nr:uncharacterized protein BKA55DRAFT_725354 [Fusarium redolens]KAH7255156.1 hypothetical protein BKA55DRAFT_725354 [Fusarium redolens]
MTETWISGMSMRRNLAVLIPEKEMQVMKHFAEFVALGTVGKLDKENELPTTDSIRNKMRRFYSNWQRKTRQTIPAEVTLSMAPLWFSDHHDYVHEGYRVDNGTLLNTHCYTSARLSELCQAKYKDVVFLVGRKDGEPELKLKIQRRVFEWKDDMLEKPIFPDWTAEGPKATARSPYNWSHQASRWAIRAGFIDGCGMHCPRRDSLLKANGNAISNDDHAHLAHSRSGSGASIEQVLKYADQQNSAVLRRNYLGSMNTIDGTGCFLGHGCSTGPHRRLPLSNYENKKGSPTPPASNSRWSGNSPTLRDDDWKQPSYGKYKKINPWSNSNERKPHEQGDWRHGHFARIMNLLPERKRLSHTLFSAVPLGAMKDYRLSETSSPFERILVTLHTRIYYAPLRAPVQSPLVTQIWKVNRNGSATVEITSKNGTYHFAATRSSSATPPLVLGIAHLGKEECPADHRLHQFWDKTGWQRHVSTCVLQYIQAEPDPSNLSCPHPECPVIPRSLEQLLIHLEDIYSVSREPSTKRKSCNEAGQDDDETSLPTKKLCTQFQVGGDQTYDGFWKGGAYHMSAGWISSDAKAIPEVCIEHSASSLSGVERRSHEDGYSEGRRASEKLQAILSLSGNPDMIGPQLSMHHHSQEHAKSTEADASSPTQSYLEGGQDSQPMAIDEDDDIWEVDRLLAKWKQGRQVLYLVKWKGFSDDANSWQRRNDISDELVSRFDAAFSDNGGNHEGAELLKKRMRRGRAEYLVRWKGRPDSDNSWEKELTISRRRVQEFATPGGSQN